MNLSTLETIEKDTILSTMYILKNSHDLSLSSLHDILDTMSSMLSAFQDSSSTCSETVIQLGNFKAQKEKLDNMLFKKKITLATLQQKNKDFNAKEELVKNLKAELAQHKACT